jgi:hypothetical protein
VFGGDEATLLKGVDLGPNDVIRAPTDDGAITYLIDFAVSVHGAAEQHNNKVNNASAKRYFRIGIATGPLDQQRQGDVVTAIAGTVIVRAVRLENTARASQIFVDIPTYDCLSPLLNPPYGPPAAREQARLTAQRSFLFHLTRINRQALDVMRGCLAK